MSTYKLQVAHITPCTLRGHILLQLLQFVVVKNRNNQIHFSIYRYLNNVSIRHLLRVGNETIFPDQISFVGPETKTLVCLYEK